MGQQAIDVVDDKRDAVARGIDSAASALREKAERLPGGPKVARAAHTTADAMQTTAGYVREHDLKGVFSDIRQIVKKHPGATLLTVTALGFMLARSLSRR
jgi:hypothetical protein